MQLSHKRDTERRKHRRVRLKEGAFAALAGPNSRSAPIGQMVDLGRDGASFLYFSSGSPVRMDRRSKLTVVTADNHFHLSDIPVKIVFDSVMLNEFPVSRSRRCGVKFIGLTRAQLMALRRLMREYTAEHS